MDGAPSGVEFIRHGFQHADRGAGMHFDQPRLDSGVRGRFVGPRVPRYARATFSLRKVCINRPAMCLAPA